MSGKFIVAKNFTVYKPLIVDLLSLVFLYLPNNVVSLFFYVEYTLLLALLIEIPIALPVFHIK